MYLHALPLPVALRVWDFVLIALRAGLAPSLPILGTALAIFEQVRATPAALLPRPCAPLPCTASLSRVRDVVAGQASGLLQDADDSSRAISVLRAFVDGLAAEDAAAAGDVSLRAEAFLSVRADAARAPHGETDAAAPHACAYARTDARSTW